MFRSFFWLCLVVGCSVIQGHEVESPPKPDNVICIQQTEYQPKPAAKLLPKPSIELKRMRLRMKRLSASKSIKSEDLSSAEQLDLVFLVDVTGSMSPYITAVRDSVFEIVRDLQTAKPGENHVKDMRVAFVGYRDHQDRNRFVVLDFTRDIAAFREVVSATRATGGGDIPEDVHGGMDKALRLNWGGESRTRMIFHMADAPAHGCDMHDYRRDSYARDPYGLTFLSLFGRINSMGVNYFFGKITSLTDKMVKRMSEANHRPISLVDIEIKRAAAGGRGIVGAGAARAPSPEDYSSVVHKEVVKAAKASLSKTL